MYIEFEGMAGSSLQLLLWAREECFIPFFSQNNNDFLTASSRTPVSSHIMICGGIFQTYSEASAVKTK
jgi:hypothetical protein